MDFRIMERKIFLRIKKKLFITFLFFLMPLVSYSWNSFGHKVIANIAYQHLTPNVRATVDNLVVLFHQDYPNVNSFLDVSAWPDAIRVQKIETYTRWHYIDVAFSNDGTPINNMVKNTDNAVWAINTIKPILSNKQANQYERMRFLSFFSHIVSDLHQPLHNVTNVSAKNPGGDKGGNLYFILLSNHPSNLHKLWDSGVETFANHAIPEDINILTNKVMTRYPEKYFGDKVDDLDPETWIKEGMSIAKQYVYNTPENQAPSAHYLDQGKQISEQQAALAGYRLAKLLNQLLGNLY